MKNIFNDMSKLKRLIVLVSIILVLLVIIMIAISLVQKENQWQEEKKELDQGNTPPTSFEKEIVTDHSTFFSVGDSIQDYLNSISFNIEDISLQPVRGSKMPNAATLYAQDEGITDEKSKRQAIYNFLNPNYISQNEITTENVLEKVPNNDKVEFTPLEMYQLLGNYRTQYAVYGEMENMETEEKTQCYFVVDVDKTNSSFYITPIEFSKYANVKDIPLSDEDTAIELNDNNYFSYTVMQENDIILKYFSYYKKLMQENPDMAYLLLDEEYRNKRFGSVEEFKNYVSKNQEEIQSYVAKEYEVNNLEEGTEYVCQDQYKHSYIFKVSAVMQFQVKLDTYTIESEEVKQRYQNADERRKVEMNVDKWFQMLNYRDYKSAYAVLDESFKAQYFQTEEWFEEYMRGKFPYYYGVNLSDYSNEAGLHIQKILLTDITAKIKMTVPETIVMKLTDDGFVMSFRVLS